MHLGNFLQKCNQFISKYTRFGIERREDSEVLDDFGSTRTSMWHRKGIKKGIEKFVTTWLFESNIFWKVKKKNLFNEIQVNY